LILIILYCIEKSSSSIDVRAEDAATVFFIFTVKIQRVYNVLLDGALDVITLNASLIIALAVGVIWSCVVAGVLTLCVLEC
jgi:hypothetical protein